MNPHDHPDLTAHVLGELDVEHAEAMAQWIAENPAASGEAERIAALSQHLHATARMPEVKLHVHQREAILSGPQIVRKMVEQAAQKSKQKTIMPFLQLMGRAAAAVLFLALGFVVGSRFKTSSAKPEIVKSIVPKSESSKPAGMQVPFRAKELPLVTTEVPRVAESMPVITPKTPVKQDEAVVIAKVETSRVSLKEPFKAAPAEMKIKVEPLISTTKSAVAELSLRPFKSRPAVVRDATAAGAPITKREAPVVATPAKKPELLIHSWKAEVAVCPWDETRRLMRLSIQMPGEQPAAVADQGYPLQVQFHPAYVRSFRPLCERVVPAPNAEDAALHVAWYEFVPNGVMTESAPKVIASVGLPNARFTTAAMGPFDGATQLQVVDRGLSWTEAGDDFLFESSVTGFGLLLKGAAPSPSLNHALVLSLAQRALKVDPLGERARFVKLVQDAQKAAGL